MAMLMCQYYLGIISGTTSWMLVSGNGVCCA